MIDEKKSTEATQLDAQQDLVDHVQKFAKRSQKRLLSALPLVFEV